MALDLDAEQLDRYSRHIIMDDVGPEGQAALLDSSVLVVGAGGLGAPVLQYLAAAGVGHIGIADDDVVELSNLQRQVIHGNDDVGRPKVDSAEEFIAALNPDVDVDTYETRVTQDNAESLIEGYDVIVDASDNFPTRFLLNDACMLADKPLSHGAVYKFEGQATTLTGGPCYRCLFPEAPPEGTIPNCAEAGVLGVLPGTIGAIQATEVIKLILDEGDTLEGRLLAYDAGGMSFDFVPIAPNPECPVCGDQPHIDSVTEGEYAGACTLGD
ncbi:molybdopterin-synthase adenylyltransferase MoeB [Halovenus sp. WSH3]|uniref:Molybdopterin-synthase adenylyltransferase MoeB n=1 Tax=Halovenus carboxidivorans TaxID=2692199 RepID=A0A6B0T2R2_9EURY|nr:molybdopterin-synthase adenylyltransferase MoeB [Halovenus carboxidivorans]MXR51417.1 molybdopterin-synthase adenylyltransferase MoeB [Halovenus carboxidivorans]